MRPHNRVPQLFNESAHGGVSAAVRGDHLICG